MSVTSFLRPVRRRPPAPSEPRKIPKTLPSDLRQTYVLNSEERQEFDKLWPQEGKAIKFWRAVADSRGLDYDTVMGVEHKPYEFTAMPMGHGKHWCWPEPLECKTQAKHFPHLVKEDSRYG
jgi:hypothetical protein